MRTVIMGLALLAALALAGSAPGLQPGPSQIRIIDRVVSETTYLNWRIIRTSLYNRAIPTPIGNSILTCMEVGARRGPVPPGSLKCSGTYRLAHGNIEVGGTITRRGLYELSVLGGTGVYSNTGAGQVAAVTINLEPREQQLVFALYST